MPIQFLSVAGDCRVRHGNDIVVFTAMTSETYWSSHYGLFLRINYFAFELSVPFACDGSNSITLFFTEIIWSARVMIEFDLSDFV